MAPIFDVLVRPNHWERRLQSLARGADVSNELTGFRHSFWEAFLSQRPEAKELGFDTASTSSIWLPAGSGIIISLFVGRTKVGLFVRGERGGNADDVAEVLYPHRNQLERDLGARYGRTTGANFFDTHRRFDMTDRANWPAAIDWLYEAASRYVIALRQISQNI